jgi:hypothetical protein
MSLGQFPASDFSHHNNPQSRDNDITSFAATLRA